MPVRSKLREYLNERAYAEKRKPYTVREVAQITDVNAGVVQKLMKDNWQQLDRNTIDKINKGLGCKTTDWFVDVPEATS